MILYLDTSAVVKLYAVEFRSAEVRRLFADAQQVASSLIAYTETRSALARKNRMRQMSDEQFKISKSYFEDDWANFNKIPLDANLVRLAGDLAETYDLKAYDAVHLACAYQMHREVRAPMRFACFDASLNRAASMLGLKTWQR